MKTTELIKVLKGAVNEGERVALAEAEQRLYAALRQALVAYENDIKLRERATERRCMICGAPVSQCCC